MDARVFGEPLWKAEDEDTGCSVECFFDKDKMIFIVVVTKLEKRLIEYFPAYITPREKISDQDFMQAKQIAVRLADKIASDSR